MKVIGLTGNIATGKSTVLHMLEQLGAHTLDADAVVHRLLRSGTAVYRSVVDTFGPGILGPDGEIDRVRLATAVFGRPEALARLEAIVHPAVEVEVERWLEDLRRRYERGPSPPDGPLVAVVDAVKLLESALRERDKTFGIRQAEWDQRLETLDRELRQARESAQVFAERLMDLERECKQKQSETERVGRRLLYQEEETRRSQSEVAALSRKLETLVRTKVGLEDEIKGYRKQIFDLELLLKERGEVPPEPQRYR